jgi:putative ATPase
MSDLFESSSPEKEVKRPLPDRLRPRRLEEIVGQDHLVGEGSPVKKMAKAGNITSMVLWGPPGTGKTTLARILASHSDMHFEQISAIFSGVADLKKVFESAKIRRQNSRGTLLFVDEIHRFNKSQQDAFLPVVEDGTITLIGATTENPSFELNGALLSRCQVFVLKRLCGRSLEILIRRAEKEAETELPLSAEAREVLKTMADGDGRYVLSMAAQVLEHTGSKLSSGELMSLVQRRSPLYDKADEGHYNLISALHKSVRGSDVDAALYWMARMIEGGEDPRFIARRLARMAVEDIGLADPQALPQCVAAWEAYERMGSPEGELALVQALIYLASAPKSNAAYKAEKAAKRAARETGSLMPPKHILNAPTKLMKEIGYSKGYKYDHDMPDAFSGQNYFPEEMDRKQLYDPPERGFEREIRKRLEYWAKLRSQQRKA